MEKQIFENLNPFFGSIKVNITKNRTSGRTHQNEMIGNVKAIGKNFTKILSITKTVKLFKITPFNQNENLSNMSKISSFKESKKKLNIF